eukprot:CFRG3439T1
MSKFTKPPLDFKSFMLSLTVRAQYRMFMREIYSVKDLKRRAELRDWVRGEYDRNIALRSEEAIKHNIKAGETGLQELRDTIKLTGMEY